MTPEIQSRLADYASGRLSPGDETALFAAAMEDQELFDLLMGQHEIREILDSPGARTRLGEVLDAELRRNSPLLRLREMLLSPRALVLTGTFALAVLAIVGLAFWRKSPGYEDLGPLGEQGQADPAFRGALALTPHTTIPLDARFNHKGQRPAYAPGEGLRLELDSTAGGSLIALEIRADGDVNVLTGRDRLAALPAGRGYWPPDGQSEMAVKGPAGVRRIRLILLPAGASLPNPDAWDEISSRITVMDLEYRVTER